ncbi:hypothetical protein H0H93_014071, partial [Arthromyces matolae]
MPQDDNGVKVVQMYLPHNDDIPAVVSVVNIVRLMRLSATGNSKMLGSFRHFERILSQNLPSLPDLQGERWTRGLKKDPENNVWKWEINRYVGDHNKRVWYNPEGSQGVEQEVKEALKLAEKEPIHEDFEIGNDWGKCFMTVPIRFTPTEIKIRIPVDADVPGVASLINIAVFMRQRVPPKGRAPDLEGFLARMYEKLRFLPKLKKVTKKRMENEDWKVQLLGIVRDHNKRQWYWPTGWEHVEKEVQAALDSAVRVPQKKIKQKPPTRSAAPKMGTVQASTSSQPAHRNLPTSPQITPGFTSPIQ